MTAQVSLAATGGNAANLKTRHANASADGGGAEFASLLSGDFSVPAAKAARPAGSEQAQTAAAEAKSPRGPDVAAARHARNEARQAEQREQRDARVAQARANHEAEAGSDNEPQIAVENEDSVAAAPETDAVSDGDESAAVEVEVEAPAAASVGDSELATDSGAAVDAEAVALADDAANDAQAALADDAVPDTDTGTDTETTASEQTGDGAAVTAVLASLANADVPAEDGEMALSREALRWQSAVKHAAPNSAVAAQPDAALASSGRDFGLALAGLNADAAGNADGDRFAALRAVAAQDAGGLARAATRAPEAPAEQLAAILAAQQTTPGAVGAAARVAAAAVAPPPMTVPPDDPGFAEGLGERIIWAADRGLSKARIELHPAELGALSVQVKMQGTEAQVSFTADNPATRAMLAQTLPQLRELFAGQGLQLMRSQIEQRGGSGRGGSERGGSAARGAGLETVTPVTRRVTTISLVDAYA